MNWADFKINNFFDFAAKRDALASWVNSDEAEKLIMEERKGRSDEDWNALYTKRSIYIFFNLLFIGICCAGILTA